MKMIALAALALAATPVLAQGDLKAFSSKFKPGLYDYKIEMEMGEIPGMPKGMGKQAMSVQHCLTDKDIDAGEVGRKDPNSKVDCQIKDMKVSAGGASYKMVCKGEMEMIADNAVTFRPDGYRMQSKMAMKQGGQIMNMTNNIDARYVGPCKN